MYWACSIDYSPLPVSAGAPSGPEVLEVAFFHRVRRAGSLAFALSVEEGGVARNRRTVI